MDNLYVSLEDVPFKRRVAVEALPLDGVSTKSGKSYVLAQDGAGSLVMVFPDWRSDKKLNDLNSLCSEYADKKIPLYFLGKVTPALDGSGFNLKCYAVASDEVALANYTEYKNNLVSILEREL